MKNLKDKRQALLLGLLAFLMILLAVNVPGKFYSVYNFQSMGFQLPELGLLSLGMLLVVITGGIDLSLTFTASLSGICCAMVLSLIHIFSSSLLNGCISGRTMNRQSRKKTASVAIV